MNDKCTIIVYMDSENQYARDYMTFEDQDPVDFFYGLNEVQELSMPQKDQYGRLVQLCGKNISAIKVIYKKDK